MGLNLEGGGVKTKLKGSGQECPLRTSILHTSALYTFLFLALFSWVAF